MDDQLIFTNMLEEIRLKNRANQEIIIKKDKNKSVFITREIYDKICSKLKFITKKFK